MPVDAKKVAAGCTCCGPDGYMPKVTFSTFILSLCSSALVHLGDAPEPESGQLRRNISLAKHTIDILDMLKCKTSKCLDADESRLLDEVLCELRMRYVRCR
jgi:hypothetical protein